MVWTDRQPSQRAVSFLSQCTASGDPGMSERIDAISRGAGKCDPESLNQNYAATAYKWRKCDYGGDSRQNVYEVHPLATVALDQLPTYCVVYNDHA
ncbi:TrbM/KikA/MpfK family conjugal transfer protein [Pollutimonas nitritireducens]|uniref:TrbM/KikA/MpfK family conjugal transfer protein n=1 Tax=Pollutimonas nitritireducens TaxID=2045209 RepID=UPI003F70E534